MIRKVAILGSGNVGKAMAADLALKGLEVNLCNSPFFLPEEFELLTERKQIDLDDRRKDVDGVRNTVKIHKATTNFEEAIKGVDYIMVTVPATAHKLYFESMMPYLEDGQTIFIWPGNFGALLFAKMLREKGVRKDLKLAESDTVSVPSRSEAPCQVRIVCNCVRFWIATLPAKNVDKVVNDLKLIYPAGEPTANVMATSLSNPNTSVHPAGTLLNAGWVDTLREDFYLYRMGTTYSVAKVIRAVYDEIQTVANAIGVQILQYPEHTFWERSTIMGAYYKAPFDSEHIVASANGPSSMKHRYISEDVPYGLVPIALLGRQYGIPTPIIGALINLASVINQADYWKEGRSLEELGIVGLSRDELLKLLENGTEAGT